MPLCLLPLPADKDPETQNRAVVSLSDQDCCMTKKICTLLRVFLQGGWRFAASYVRDSELFVLHFWIKPFRLSWELCDFLFFIISVNGIILIVVLSKSHWRPTHGPSLQLGFAFLVRWMLYCGDKVTYQMNDEIEFLHKERLEVDNFLMLVKSPFRQMSIVKATSLAYLA